MGELSRQDRDDFKRLDKIVCDGIRTFVIVGNALAEINERQLWSEEYEDFSHYLDQYGMSTTYAYDLMKSAKTTEHVSAIADTAPVNEAQARELTKAGDKAPEAWEKAQEKAEAKGKPVTAAEVKEAVKEVTAEVPAVDYENTAELEEEELPAWQSTMLDADLELDEILRVLRGCRRLMPSPNASPWIGESIGTAKSQLNACINSLESMRGAGKCHKCDGAGRGCLYCHESGFLNRDTAASRVI